LISRLSPSVIDCPSALNDRLPPINAANNNHVVRISISVCTENAIRRRRSEQRKIAS
jgi:hypothetical protein